VRLEPPERDSGGDGGADGFGDARVKGSKERKRPEKKPEEYRYAGEVKQNRNETVKRRFDGAPIKARDDGRPENLFVRNSSSSSVPLDYRRSLLKPSPGKMSAF
jgi:hypothetical protein